MKPFEQRTSAYSAVAKTIVIPANTNYDVAIVDNPVRKRVNAALIIANNHEYRSQVTL